MLLRVVGPPYYTLLRALEREEVKKGPGVRAYLGAAPGACGWNRLHADLPSKRFSRKTANRCCCEPTRLGLSRRRPVSRHLRNPRLQAAASPPRLGRRRTQRAPDGAVALIDGDRADPGVVGLAPERRATNSTALFLRCQGKHAPTAPLRRRQPGRRDDHRSPRPALEAAAAATGAGRPAYTKFLKLDNLFVPVGTKVHPVLRRDAIRKLLADDPAQINWLEPHPEKPGYFTPESLPDDAFRPLQDWVEYVLDHDRQQLASWVQEFRFDFDPFICPEEAEPKPKPPGPGRRRRDTGPEVAEIDADALPNVKATSVKKKDAPEAERDDFAEIEILPPTQLQKELTVLEGLFLGLDGSLDDPERLKLWPELALRNAALKHTADAALCWMNRLWEEPDASEDAQRMLAWNWVRTEQVLAEPELTVDDLDRQMKNETPSMAEVRAFISCLVWGSLQEPVPAALLRRLPQVQQHLEKFERSVGVRAVWLGWHALCKVANNDALGLARIRDRLLDRLITEGLSPERDLPNFLRSAGHHDSERMRVVRAHAMKLHEACLQWCEDCGFLKTTAHYVDLVFSFGMARLGESTTSRELLKKAEGELPLLRRIDENEIRELQRRATKNTEEARSIAQSIDVVEGSEKVRDFIFARFGTASSRRCKASRTRGLCRWNGESNSNEHILSPTALTPHAIRSTEYGSTRT